mmetsp:Transcript_62584/g.139382  ORF Transcript_62584/g.139382 Transcript_62584/m.139382 type:complete len:245 (-) Transcript_62584:30-764(-)
MDDDEAELQVRRSTSSCGVSRCVRVCVHVCSLAPLSCLGSTGVLAPFLIPRSGWRRPHGTCRLTTVERERRSGDDCGTHPFADAKGLISNPYIDGDLLSGQRWPALMERALVWLPLTIHIRPHEPIAQRRRNRHAQVREVRLASLPRRQSRAEEKECKGALLALYARLACRVVVVMRAKTLARLVSHELQRFDKLYVHIHARSSKHCGNPGRDLGRELELGEHVWIRRQGLPFITVHERPDHRA